MSLRRRSISGEAKTISLRPSKAQKHKNWCMKTKASPKSNLCLKLVKGTFLSSLGCKLASNTSMSSLATLAQEHGQPQILITSRMVPGRRLPKENSSALTVTAPGKTMTTGEMDNGMKQGTSTSRPIAIQHSAKCTLPSTHVVAGNLRHTTAT